MLQLDLGLGLCAALFGVSWRALGTPAGSLWSWFKELTLFVAACVVASIFAVWASPRLWTLAGVWAGTLLCVALPPVAVAAGSYVLRRIRAHAAAD